MKLPLKSGRYAALKRLLVFVGTIADDREQWSQLAGVPAAIEKHSPSAKTPLTLNFDVDLLAATHVRLRALPTEEGRAGVWGLRIGDEAEGAVTVSRTTSHMVTLIGDVCGPRSRQPVLKQTAKLEFTSGREIKKLRAQFEDDRRTTLVGQHEMQFDPTRGNARVREKATVVADLTVTCAIYPRALDAAGDVWGFIPGADTTTNVWRKKGEAASPVPQSSSSSDPPRIPELFYVWRSPGTGAFAKPGKPAAGDQAYIPFKLIEDHAFAGNNKGFKHHFLNGDGGWRGTLAAKGMRSGVDHFQLNVAACDSRWLTNCAKPDVRSQWFVSADLVSSKLGFRSQAFHGMSLYRGWQLDLPTTDQACARELDAEGVCSGVKRALELASRSHGNERPRIASGLAPFISRTTWVEQGYGSKELYMQAKDWHAEHGSCGREFEDERDLVFERPGGTCKDNVTPYVEAFRWLDEVWYPQFSKQCPWMGTTGTGEQAGMLFDIRIWTLPYTHVCRKYADFCTGRLDCVSESTCNKYAGQTLAHRYRYLRAANCMCGQCHAAHTAIEEWSEGFSTTTNKNDLAAFEYFVLSFPTLVQIPSLPSDSYSRPFCSSSAHEITVLLEINVIGDRSRTYGFVAHPGARRIVDGLQTAGFGVALFSCEGVKESEVLKLEVPSTVAVIPGQLCESKMPQPQPWRVDMNRMGPPVGLASARQQRQVLVVATNCMLAEALVCLPPYRASGRGRNAAEIEDMLGTLLAQLPESQHYNTLATWITDLISIEKLGSRPAWPAIKSQHHGSERVRITRPTPCEGVQSDCEIDNSISHSGFLAKDVAPAFLALSVGIDLANGDLFLDFRFGESCALRADAMAADLIKNLNKAAGRHEDRLVDMLSASEATPQNLLEIYDAIDMAGVAARGGAVHPLNSVEALLNSLAEYRQVAVAAVLASSIGHDSMVLSVSKGGFAYGLSFGFRDDSENKELVLRSITEFGSFGDSFYTILATVETTTGSWSGPGQYAILALGPDHKSGPSAPLQPTYSPNSGMVTVDMTGNYAFESATQLFVESERRECNAAAVSARCNRLRVLKRKVLVDFPSHMVQTAHQNARLDALVAAVTAAFIVIQFDFKQNFQCRDECRASQQDYFCIPTCAFHGFTLYTANGLHYRDQWSFDKEKDTCLLSATIASLYGMEKDGLLDLTVVKKIVFVSDNGAPYHGGEWLATLLGVQPTDISYGAIADEFFSKFEIEAMFLITGEGKGNEDAHFSMVSQCEKVWVNKGSADTMGGSSLNKLTESTMPDLMRFCERWIGSTKIEMLPEGFRDACPKGEFNKLSGVRGLHHFWNENGVIKARAYSHFGPVKEVEVEKGVKRADKKKRSVKIDQKRKAAVNAVQWYDRVVGRHPNWVNPPGGTRRCRSEAWGHVSCARFAKATKDNSPFSKVNMMCWDEVDQDMRKLATSSRYKDAGIVWKPSAASTPHTIFCRVGDMELLYLGSVASPAIAVPDDGVPTQAHFDNWDQVERSKRLPFEATQIAAGAAASASTAAGTSAPAAATAVTQTADSATSNTQGSASGSAEIAAGSGANMCASGTCLANAGAATTDDDGANGGDGDCVPIACSACCPAVDLPEDEDDEEEDL